MKRETREEMPEVDEESWYVTAETFSPYRPKSLQRRVGHNPVTTGVLEDPLPHHFKSVNYGYDSTIDSEDHMAKFDT